MLTVAISSRSLFQMDESHSIFIEDGQSLFNDHMRDNEHIPLQKGSAFSLVKKLLQLNSKEKTGRDKVEVILLSRNSPEAGIRVMNSIKHYGLDIECAVFTQCSDRFAYASALGAHLFLSTNAEDVSLAIKNGIAAATMPTRGVVTSIDDEFVRIAFDGDSVLFSADSDHYFKEHGLEKFKSEEERQSNVPLNSGPFRNFICELARLQREFPKDRMPIKIALVTARGAPAHERVLKTLRTWGVTLDEAVFAGGRSKGPLLKAFGADIFFDDAQHNIANANLHNIVSGHVPFGPGHGISITPISPNVSVDSIVDMRISRRLNPKIS